MRHLKLWGKILLYIISFEILIIILAIPVILYAYYFNPILFKQMLAIGMEDFSVMTNTLIVIQAVLSLVAVFIISYLFRKFINLSRFFIVIKHNINAQYKKDKWQKPKA